MLKEKFMSKYRYEMGGVIRDTEIDFPYHTDDIVDLLDEKDQQISDLEAKLAEKDEEIEYQESMKILAVENKNQKAIEQLEKVKEFVSRQLFITTKGCSDLDEAEAKGCNELREEIIKEIDNQINGLKGE